MELSEILSHIGLGSEKAAKVKLTADEIKQFHDEQRCNVTFHGEKPLHGKKYTLSPVVRVFTS